MSEIANTPSPPYYAVIFTSRRTNDDDGYSDMSKKMIELAEKQPGFLGAESARESVGITVSYWVDLESIQSWKANSEHIVAQRKGKEIWYSEFKTRICKVEKDYSFIKNA